jgi:hypothetical protein
MADAIIIKGKAKQLLHIMQTFPHVVFKDIKNKVQK